MKKIWLSLASLGLLLLLSLPPAHAQNSPNCVTVSTTDYLTGRAFFNYGSVSNSYNTKNRVNVTVGQPVVGTLLGQKNKGALGFWARFLMPPGPPSVSASEGDLEDRIQVDWDPDPLSPSASSYKIYRNGTLLATVDGETFSFIDFNVIAGKFYTYAVSGVNTFGEGSRASSLGFLNPNGVVTGQVKTFSGNPVNGAVVTLSPTLGASVRFTGDDMAFADYNTVFPRNQFTLSAWVKLGSGNDGAAIFDMGSTISKNWWLHTLPAASGKGVRFGVGKGGGQKSELSYAFPAETANDWHYVAASYNGSSLLLYVDGELIETAVTTIAADSMPLFFGQAPNASSFYTGSIDEVRFFNRQLAQTEIQMYMNQTVSASTDGLVAYWKFDEGVGSKAFDITDNQSKLYFCGALWNTTDKPKVVNAGVTDETGYYKIEGVNYGAGTTFSARPSKDFHFNQSLEFSSVNQTYADLTTFGLRDSSALTLTVKAFDFSGKQAILSKADASGANQFAVCLNTGNLEVAVGSTTKSFGALGMGYHHLAFLLRKSGSDMSVEVYKNGTLVGTETFPAPSGWTGKPWKLATAASGATGHQDYFTGLVDEAAFFSTPLPLHKIQEYANIGTGITDTSLVSYFNLNEGIDTTLSDMGTALTGKGKVQGARWSTVVAIAQTEPHLFTPSTRLVTLNPSNTSVDQVDFTDQSTIPVSGYVRYDGTDCFVAGAEILVNGKRNIPAVFTDENGYFSIDLEPGATVQLSPTYNGHTFYPAFWEIIKASTPVAGILFRDQVKRTVTGQMAGNAICRKSVIPANAIVKVKVESLDGCYSKVMQLTEANGKYQFKDLPPIPMTVAVTEHSNNVIYNYFQLQGGAQIDLTNESDTVDFIYYSPPQIEISPLDTNLCGDPMLEQAAKYSVEFRVYQPYTGGNCYLDTADFRIINDIQGSPAFDTVMTEGKLKYRFAAGVPNIASPYLKTMTVQATANTLTNTATTSAVVLGKRPRQVNFTSTSPEIPIMILRDPPGDGSNATIEKGTTVCSGWSIKGSASSKASAELGIKLGLDQTISTGIGVEKETKVKVENTTTLGLSATFSSNVANEMETCMTANETISTSGGDVVIGEDADVYVGGALNLLFGITDDLRYDTANCAYEVKKGVVVFPDKFATTFLYTGYQIERVVIPNLELVGDTASAQQWKRIIEYNKELKKRAVFERNFSFDAGVSYSSSTSTEITESFTYGFDASITASIASELGIEVDGIGLKGKIGMELTMGVGTSFSSKQTRTQTVSYSFGDDDTRDVFTVDVLRDRVYGTPVFRTVSGNSSCPHEPRTVPRDGVELTVDRTIATNVLANEAAVFKFNVGNISETDEYRSYVFELYNATNTNGAKVKIQGTELSGGVFGMSAGQSQEVIVTIERGPSAYKYENLTFHVYSACEGARYDALGNGDFPPAPFYKAININVEFLEPCSPIDIGFPMQNWVVTPAGGSTMFITLNKFQRNDPDLELIRVQYRRKQGDGAWINIVEVPKAQLDDDVFKIVQWNTTGLKDGEYELRAVTQCTGGQNAGISTIMTGRFEREPPEILGTPEPADGVLSTGDEISITFTEPIKCDALIQADFFNNNNIGLYNTQTGKLVDAVITCNRDKIVIVPNVPNRFIENTVLRVQVNNIKDLAGNNFLEKKWEFFVDRNPVRWVEDVVEVVKLEEETVTVTRKLENIGGQALVYDLKGAPNWAKVFPMSGTLAPGASQNVAFTFDNATALGRYKDTIFADGPLGAEPIYLDLRVACPPPSWALNRAGFSFSMNMTLELNIEGTVSGDNMDIVAAFVGRELRGLAKVQYSTELKKHLVFMTVYSNQAVGDTVTFQVWDASACKLYGSTIETFAYQADGLVGSPLVPQVLRTNNMLLAKIPINPGWNWISYNVGLPDPAVNKGLMSLSSPQGGLIKGQTAFSSYSNTLQAWAGNLKNLSHLTMYQYKSTSVDSLLLLGMPVDPSTPIPVVSGWNWIGFLPQRGMRVSEALASLTPLNGDLIKGQFTFAQFVAGLGWIGNLSYMSSPNGYLLKLSNAGTLVYPAVVSGELAKEGELEKGKFPALQDKLPYSHWKVKPEAYEQSMNVIAVVERKGEGNILGEGDEVGAFMREELRGSSQVIYVEGLKAYLVFLTVYANREGEQLRFRYFNATEGKVYELQETAVFRSNSLLGLADVPLVLTPAAPTGVEVLEGLEGGLKVYPNPTHEVAFLEFGMAEAQPLMVLVTDALGREVWRRDYEAQQGLNVLEWRPASSLPAGWYFVTLRGKTGVKTAKIEVVR